MYWVLPRGLRKMDYCNRIKGFINYALSNLRNISGCNIRCPFKRCKNKKILDSNVVTMHILQKKVHEEILVLVYTRRTICSLWDHDVKDDSVNF